MWYAVLILTEDGVPDRSYVEVPVLVACFCMVGVVFVITWLGDAIALLLMYCAALALIWKASVAWGLRLGALACAWDLVLCMVRVRCVCGRPRRRERDSTQ